MKPRHLIAIGVAVAFSAVGTAVAQEVVLKSADVHPPGYPSAPSPSRA